jgi:hypothetical protein
MTDKRGGSGIQYPVYPIEQTLPAEAPVTGSGQIPPFVSASGNGRFELVAA